MFYIDFCCDILQCYLDEPGQKGINILVSKNSEQKYGFVLQTRNADYGDRSINPITITQTGIMYCPWCGIKLSRFSKKFKESMYEQHKDMLIESQQTFGPAGPQSVQNQ
jgi:hypothetical protein